MSRGRYGAHLVGVVGVVGAAVAASTLASCARLSGEVRQRPHLLLVVVDTLRADRLGVYGYSRPTSPVLDALAARSWAYRQALTPAPFTMPAMAAMFTGHYPDRTGVVNHTRAHVLDTELPTLAERLRAAGYHTLAVVSNPWLENRAMRFDRGFDAFVTRNSLRRSARLDAATVTDRALAHLARFEEGPTFLWAHYMDTHMPYEPPDRLARLFGNPAATSRVIELFKRPGVAPQRIYFATDLEAEEVERTRALYDASVRAVDEQIGRLFEGLRRRNLWDRTIVVVVADHGESLGDHGLYFAHDFTLYEELMRVPLIVHVPSSEPARISSLVSTLDLVPSLCAWMRLRCRESFDGRVWPTEEPGDGPGRFAGRTLFGAAAPARRRYSRSPFIHVEGIDGRWTMARTHNFKLIRIPRRAGPRGPRADWEAYDLDADPQESRNLLAQVGHDPRSWPAHLRRLRASLLAWRAEMARTHHVPRVRTSRFDETSRQRLEALGYLH